MRGRGPGALAGACLVLLAPGLPDLALADGVVEHRTRSVTARPEPVAELEVHWLLGIAPPRLRDARPGQLDPTWIEHWRRQATAGLQPEALARRQAHLLADAKPVVLGLGRGPGPGREVDWAVAICPPSTEPAGGRTEVTVSVLFARPEGEHTLGLQTACLDSGGRTRQWSRLVVRTDPFGRPLLARGLVFTPTRPSRGSGWPLGLAPLPRPWQALYVPADGRWLAQVAWQEGPEIAVPPEPEGSLPADGLPGASLPLVQDPRGRPELRRGVLVFSRTGEPEGSLLDRGVGPAAAREPVPGEGLTEIVFPGRPPLFLLRVARRQEDPRTGARLLREGGYVAWQSRPGLAPVEVPLDLPVLAMEGLWQCEPVDQRPLLACRFTGSGLPGSVEPPDRHLQPNAAGQWVVRPR